MLWFGVLPCHHAINAHSSRSAASIENYMGVKVRCPLLCVHVSFVLVYMDLKRFNTETFLADRSELLEFLHGGFLLDYYYPLPYWCCFSLHLLPNRIEISLFRTLQPMGDAISNPAFIQMTKFRTNIVQLFSLKL